jgi:hypothetical protein
MSRLGDRRGCAVGRCERTATRRVRMIPDGGPSRTVGFALTCADHVAAISERANQIMGAVQAGREALVADRYRVEVDVLEPGQPLSGGPPPAREGE